MEDIFHRLAEGFLDILFPPSCPYCQKLLKHEETSTCTACEKTLPFLSSDAQVMPMERGGLCLSAALYEGKIRSAFLRYKFKGRHFYAPIFAKKMAKSLDFHPELHYDAITWVPVSPKTMRRRGYDQAYLLAKEVASLKEEESLLISTLKSNKKKKQSHITDPNLRAENVAGKFSVPDQNLVKNKIFLLVDDVFTTGATLSVCRKALLDAGARDVICLCFCRSSSTEEYHLKFESFQS